MIIKQPQEHFFPSSLILWLTPLLLVGAIYFVYYPRLQHEQKTEILPAGDQIIFDNDLETFAGEHFVSDSFL
ncbi:MAG: hypothetical protein KDC53_04795, partial [Saprospiraceae bacterium]|nr:hypothetical protein [Saprospiraceae bacterium]